MSNRRLKEVIVLTYDPQIKSFLALIVIRRELWSLQVEYSLTVSNLRVIYVEILGHQDT